MGGAGGAEELQAENPRLPLLSNSPFPGLQEFQKQSVPLTERAKNPGVLFQRARVGSKLPCGQLTAPGSLNSRGFSHRASVGATLKCVCPYTQLQTAGEMAQWLG